LVFTENFFKIAGFRRCVVIYVKGLAPGCCVLDFSAEPFCELKSSTPFVNTLAALPFLYLLGLPSQKDS
jgi:hypothetical protein